jgi:flavin-binding protein dodecin
MATMIEIDAKFRSSGADKVKSDARGIGEEINRLESGGKKLAAIGAGLTAGLAVPLGIAGAKAIGEASNVNESLTATQEVYGDYANSVIKSSQDAASAVGLSQAEYLEGATNLAVYGKMAGYAGDDLVDFGADGLHAAADLASFYNAPVPEALAAIRSGLIGETEPLRRFGILLSEDTVKAKAMEMGLADANGEISEGSKVAARHALIMEQMNDAQGDFARTSDGLANSQRILQAELANLSAEFGQALLPAVEKGVQILRVIVGAFSALPAPIKTVIAAVAALAAALGPVLAAVGAAMLGLNQLGPVFARLGPLIARFGSFFLSPIASIGRLGGALAALGPVALAAGAALGLAFLAYKTNFLGFGDLVDGVVNKAKEFGSTFGEAFERRSGIEGASGLSAGVGALGEALEKVTGLPVAGFFDAASDGLVKMGRTFQAAVAKGINPFHAGLKALGKWGGETIKNMTAEAAQWVDAAFGPEAAAQFTEFGNQAADTFDTVMEGVNKFADTLASDGLGAALKTLPDSVKAAWGEIKELGSEMLDFGEEVLSKIVGPEVAKNVTDALRKVGDAVGGGIEWIWGTAIPKIGEAGETVLNAFKGVFEPVGEWIQDTALPAIGDAAENFGQFLGESFTQLGDIVGPALGTMFDMLGTTLARAGEWLEQVDWAAIGSTIGGAFESLGNTLGGVKDAIGNAFDTIGTAIDKARTWLSDIDWSGIGQTIGGGFSLLGSVLSGAGDAIGTAFSKIGEAFNAAKEWLSAVDWSGIGQTIGGGFSLLGSTLATAGEAIGAAFETIGEAINKAKEWLGAVDWAGIGQTIGGGFSLLGGTLESARGAITTAFTAIGEAINSAKEWLTAVDWASIGTTIGGGFSLLGSTLATAGESIGKAFEDIGTAVSNIGTALGEVDLSAFTSLGGEIVAQLRAGWDSAIEGFKSIFKSLPGSLASLVPDPGSAFTTVGGGIVAGLRQGWDGAIESFKTIFKNLGTSLASLVTIGGEWAAKAGEIITGFIGGWTDSVQPLKDIFTNFGSDIVALVGPGIASIVSAFEPILTLLGDLVTKAGEAKDAIGGAIGGAFSALGSTVSGWTGGGEEGGETPQVDPAQVSAAAAELETLRASIATAATEIVTNLTTIGTAFTTLQTTITTALSSIATEAGTFVGSMAGFFGATLTTPLTNAGTAFETFKTTATTALTEIATQTGTHVATIAGLLSGNLGTALTNAGTAISTFATNATTAISQWVSTSSTEVSAFADLMGSEGQRAGDTFKAGLEAGLSGAAAAVTAALGEIRGAVAGFSLEAEGRAIGISFGQGIVSGMQSMLGNVQSMGAQLVAAANQGATTEGEIASPSKLTRREVGRPLGAGVVEGMLDMMPDVSRAASAIIDLVAGKGSIWDIVPNINGLRSSGIGGNDPQVVVGAFEGAVSEFMKLPSELRRSMVKAAGENMVIPKGYSVFEDGSIGKSYTDQPAYTGPGSESRRSQSDDIAPLLTEAVADLKAYKGDNTPPEIVAVAKSLERLIETLERGDSEPVAHQPIQLMLDRQTLLDEVLVPIMRAYPRSKASESPL